MTKTPPRSRLAAPPSGKYDSLDVDAPVAPAPVTADPLVARILANRPVDSAEAKPETKTYGRRAKGFAQLNVTVQPELKRRLQRYATDREVTMAEVIEQLLRDSLPDH